MLLVRQRVHTELANKAGRDTRGAAAECARHQEDLKFTDGNIAESQRRRELVVTAFAEAQTEWAAAKDRHTTHTRLPW